ncbi:MAG: hypothetical protein H6707_02230 [Deltaproteobacteria bacterium]|nr:hypothetical protein [Deltaproteobacteria bacterium]
MTICLCACGDSGSYRLSWTLGCADARGPCQVVSVFSCAQVGIDQVQVEAVRDGKASVSRFPCFDRLDGAKATGPGLAAGEFTLNVVGLTPDGHVLTDAVSQTVTIPESGVVEVSVDISVAKQCADGVDNDGDGATDAFDPQCSSADDDSER